MNLDWLDRAASLGGHLWGCAWPFAALLLAASYIPTIATPASAASESQARLERLFVDNEIQRELPRRPAQQAPDTSSSSAGSPPPTLQRSDEPASQNNGDAPAQSRVPPRERSPVGDPGPALRIFLWVVVGALAIIVLFHISNALIDRARAVGKKPQEPVDQAGGTRDRPANSPTPRVPPNPLSAAEDLARAGKYNDAVHLVLLIAIERLKESFGGIGQSLTSLEVTQKLPPNSDARPAFAMLVLLVELSHFGGRPLAEPDYRRSKKNFEDLFSLVGEPS